MIKKEFIINNEIGLHARPAATFVDLTSRFEAEIKLIFKDTEVNAKSIISVLSLGLGKGDSFKLKIKGPDEKEALKKLYNFIKENIGEEKENNDDIVGQNYQ